MLSAVAVVAALAVLAVLTWPLLEPLWRRLQTETGLPWPVLIVFGVSVLLLVITALRRRRRRTKARLDDDAFTTTEATQAPTRRRRDERVPAGCLWGPGLFLVVGLAFSLFFVLPAIKSLRALDWQQTECQILASSVATHSGDDGATYSVEVTYRYEVDDVEYTGDRYRFLGGSSSGRKGKQKVVDSLPPGSTTTCWVNPDDPADAVLDRGLSWEYAFALLPLVFVLLGGVGLILALRARATAGEKGVTAERAMSDAMRPFGGEERDVLPEPVTGPLELEPTASPLGKLLGVSLFAVIWNGILGIFVWQLVREPECFLGCFLIPFVLVGLLLLVGIPYQALALANPRPHLRLTEARLRPEGATNLHWHFTGATGRLRTLRIDLEGRETVHYRSGDSSSNSTATIARLELVDQRQRGLLGQGNVLVEIPAGAMHTFRGRRNQVIWVLTVRAEIARWPDVNEEFEVSVFPEVAA